MIVFTGGTGRLGTELKKWFPDDLYPAREELDITVPYSILDYFGVMKPKMVVHCAAFTSPPVCEKNPLQALRVNIEGTAYLAEYCTQKKIPLVYISTEYVFDGKDGNYSEEDAVHPVNLYGWTKLGGECAVRIVPEHLIIRCAFTPMHFLYERAPTDQYSSRDTVDIIAKQIYTLISGNARGVFHIGTERKSVWDLAHKTARHEVKRCSYKDFDFVVPEDGSLNTSKYIEFEENT